MTLLETLSLIAVGVIGLLVKNLRVPSERERNTRFLRNRTALLVGGIIAALAAAINVVDAHGTGQVLLGVASAALVGLVVAVITDTARPVPV